MIASDLHTVSVVIPAWNVASFIARSVSSVQSGQDGVLPDGTRVEVTEIIVVDDCSQDGTFDVLTALAAQDPRIKLSRNIRNLGAGPTRNAGISVAGGGWIAVLDADDAFAPGRLPRLIGTAIEHGFEVISDLPVMYDLAARAAAPQQLPASGRVERLALRDLLRPDPETGLELGLLKPVFRRRLATEGRWHYPDIRHGEDFALYFDLVWRGVGFGLLREALYVFSTRIGAISGTYSPGSVTRVNYRAMAAYASELAKTYAAQPDADQEVLDLLAARSARALRLNRIYGWTVLRKGEGRRLLKWLRQDPANLSEMLRLVAAKLAGQRGLPD